MEQKIEDVEIQAYKKAEELTSEKEMDDYKKTLDEKSLLNINIGYFAGCRDQDQFLTNICASIIVEIIKLKKDGFDFPYNNDYEGAVELISREIRNRVYSPDMN